MTYIKIRYKGFLAAFFLIAFSYLCKGQNDTLRVMTYNIRFGELATLEELGGYIRSQDPDIVTLQECDWKTYRKRAPEQNGKAFINELAFQSGLFGVFGKAIDYAGGYYGVGILSKYPIVKCERILLPNPEKDREQRTMLVADIELPDNMIITVIATHLEVSSEETRKAQAEFIISKVKEINHPVILAGDFNATPVEVTISQNFGNWLNATDNSLTYPAKSPEMKIDYIFCYPAGMFSLLFTTSDPECKLSDHIPVRSVITLKTDNQHTN